MTGAPIVKFGTKWLQSIEQTHQPSKHNKVFTRAEYLAISNPYPLFKHNMSSVEYVSDPSHLKIQFKDSTLQTRTNPIHIHVD